MISDILAFSGSIGSGKSTLSIELSKALNYKYASFGNFVRKEAFRMGYIEASRDQLQKVGEILVENGIKGFCLSVLQDVVWTKGEGLVIDGIRHLEATASLRDILYPQRLFLIYVAVDEQTRISRLINRGRDESLTIDEKHSTEIQVHNVLKSKADFVVDGTDTTTNNIRKITSWLNTQI